MSAPNWMISTLVMQDDETEAEGMEVDDNESNDGETEESDLEESENESDWEDYNEDDDILPVNIGD